MSCHAGPEIANDGLVFSYDMSNTQKSWVGAPTTNLAPYTDYSNKSFNTLYDIGGFGGDDADVYYYSSGGYNNLPYKKMIKHTSGTGGSFITEHEFFTLQEGKTYTISCYMKSNMNSVIVSGHTLALNRNIDNAYRVPADITLSDTWQRKTWTYTCAVGEGGTTYQFRQIVYNDANLPLEVYWSGMQIQEGTFATPYTNGSRSNTQAILDLSNNNTITANSLTYASDNTFSFNGTSDYQTLSSSIDCHNKSYTLEAWIKRNAGGVAHGIIGDLQFSWFVFQITSGNRLFLQHKYLTPGETINNITGNIDILSNAWYHVVGTFDTVTGMKLYVNGNLDNTNSNNFAFGLSGTTRGPKYLGRVDTGAFGSGTTFFNGSISNFKAYSGKALSPDEVKQNFIATRSRYGL